MQFMFTTDQFRSNKKEEKPPRKFRKTKHTLPTDINSIGGVQKLDTMWLKKANPLIHEVQ